MKKLMEAPSEPHIHTDTGSEAPTTNKKLQF